MKESNETLEQKAGFFNLGIIFISTLLIIFIKEENVLQVSFGYLQTELIFTLFYYFYSVIYLSLAFFIIKYSFKFLQKLSYILLQVSYIYFSVFFIYSQHLSVLSSLISAFILFIYTMKLHSFTEHPLHDNISFTHFFYFLIIPTLIFRELYEKTDRIEVNHVIKYISQIMFCLIIDTIIYFHFIDPFILESHRHEVFSKEFIYIVIKLSIPWFSLWLIATFGFFYSYLHLLSELTYFKHRDFYQDWWNSGSFEEFWRKWK